MNKNIKETFVVVRKRVASFFNNVDLLGIVFPLLMVIPNIILDVTEQMSLWAKIANVLVPLSIYYLLASVVKRIGIAVLLSFVFILMNGFQIVVLYLYGESIIAVDMLLNCVTTNPSEASELLSNLSLPMLVDAIIYIPLLIWAIYTLFKKLRTTVCFRSVSRRYGLIGLAAGIAFTIVATIVSDSYAVNRQLYPFNVVSNIGTALNRTWQSVNYHVTSDGFEYGTVDTHPADSREIYVLVIGETSRAINWELFGYDRPTNPLLSEREDLTLFPRAISQSNTTHKCVPMMITHTRPETFDSIMYRKSIITAFNEAGYRTSVFSNQAKNHSYTQFFAEEADSVLYLERDDHYDMNLVGLLKRQVADTLHRKQFIILHAYGSHFNYKERYPEAYSYFKPDNASDANVKHRSELLNAYDNTIRYTDAMLNDIFDIVAATGARATVVYTSDHGEDIFDDERGRFLHASPVPTYYQIHVPLIVWCSESYAEAYPNVVASIKRNADKYVAPSQAVFFSLLDIAGLKTKYNDSRQSFSSSRYQSPEPVYLNDLNESVPLRESGLRDHDIEILESLRIL